VPFTVYRHVPFRLAPSPHLLPVLGGGGGVNVTVNVTGAALQATTGPDTGPASTDSFNRANGALGSNWTEAFAQNNGDLAIVSNAVHETASAPLDRIYLWNASAITANQFSEIIVGSAPISSDWVAAVVRETLSPIGGYLVILYSGAANLYAHDAAGYTFLAASGTLGGFNPGDVLRLTVSGGSGAVKLTVTYNGSTVITYSDLTWNYTSGQPGIGAAGLSGSIDLWTGGPSSAVYVSASATVSPTGASLALTEGTVVAGGTSPDVTVTLTGLLISASRGTLTITSAVSISVTGTALGSSAGTSSESGAASVSPTGTLATSARGTPTVSGGATISPTGTLITSNSGIVSETGTAVVTLTGTSVQVLEGSPTVVAGGSISVPATGNLIAASRGTVTVTGNASVSPTGVLLTSARGTITASFPINVNVTGTLATISQGSVTESGSAAVSLTGNLLTSARGTVIATPGVIVSVSGSQLTASRGTVAISGTAAVLLSGNLATISEGNPAIFTAGNIAVNVAGNALSAQLGTLGARIDVGVALIGQLFTTGLGIAAAAIGIDVHVIGQGLTLLYGQILTGGDMLVVLGTGLLGTLSLGTCQAGQTPVGPLEGFGPPVGYEFSGSAEAGMDYEGYPEPIGALRGSVQ